MIVMLVLVLVLDRASLFMDTHDLYCICFDLFILWLPLLFMTSVSIAVYKLP